MLAHTVPLFSQPRAVEAVMKNFLVIAYPEIDGLEDFWVLQVLTSARAAPYAVAQVAGFVFTAILGLCFVRAFSTVGHARAVAAGDHVAPIEAHQPVLTLAFFEHVTCSALWVGA
jgi:hypothetical protein